MAEMTIVLCTYLQALEFVSLMIYYFFIIE